ncbi:unnamed protein product [Alopecurus aequalis]
MKLAQIVLLALALLLLLNLNVCRVESARPQGLGVGHHPPGTGHHPPGEGHHNDDAPPPPRNSGHKHGHKHKHDDPAADYDGFSFYVFGDSFVDNGNLPHKNDAHPEMTRQWYDPYSSTGRFSNNQMVQSDYIANMLGQSESPPAHLGAGHAGPAGMNFAAGGSGVFKVAQDVPTLGVQVDAFHRLVRARKIKQDHLEGNSVALVAVSGNDYNRITVDTSGFGSITAFVDKVTTEIADSVARLQEIGVQRVLVNNLYPVGCAPSQSRPSGYASCDEQGNQGAALHNRYLAEKLKDVDGVLVLDVSAAFNEIVADGADNELANSFPRKLQPCCESVDPSGYCGLRTYDSYSVPTEMYTLCNYPDGHFFWDDMNPTQAGWAAVMGQLQGPIKEFLGINA